MANPYLAGPWDFYYDSPHGDAWCEHKYMKRSFKVIEFDWAMDKLLTPRQKLWGQRRMDNGRKVAIITGFEDKAISIAVPHKVIERSFDARETAEWIEQWLRGQHDR